MRGLILLTALALAACAPEPPPEVPPEPVAEDKPVPENLHIVINPDGRIFWQGEEISEGEYYRRMGEAMAQRSGPFALAIRADGSYALDGVTLTLEQLDAMLSGLSTAEPVPEINLEPDRLARFRDVAAAVTVLQRHGHSMTKVGVIGGGPEQGGGHNIARVIETMEREMREAAANLEFERAAQLRDEVRKLRETELGLVQ